MSVQIARAHHAGDTAAIARLCRRSTRLILALVVPPTLVLFVAAPHVLALIGPEFARGAGVMRILLVVQIVHGLLCSAGQVFIIKGRPRTNIALTTLTTGGFLGLAPLLYAAIGMEGVAIASLLFFFSRGVAEFIIVWRTIGINGISGRVRE
jgi:O-antigen/teichoic acid export membrane protein